MQRCKFCRRAVLWTVTAKGRRMPLDDLPDRQAGNVLIVENLMEARAFGTQVGRAVTLNAPRAANARLHGRDLYLSHWATCPDRARARAETDAKK